MADARVRDQWNHTSHLIWATFQQHTKKKIDPRTYNPFEAGKVRNGTPLTAGGLAAALGLKK